jgi:hypothetical protein
MLGRFQPGFSVPFAAYPTVAPVMSFDEGSIVMRRITVLVAVAVATALSAAATLAQAAAPQQEWIPIDETFTQNSCGFPIQEHDVLTLHLTTWSDGSGAPQRQIVTAPGARITWTNPATGASVSSQNPFAVHKTFNADGSVTVALTGLSFAIRGGGQAYVASGRALFVFSNGSVTPISGVGPSDDLCEALAAAIG